jgi:hypothetical protein
MGNLNRLNYVSAYGGIYVKDNAVETAISVATEFVQVAVFGANAPSHRVTPDHTSNHLRIEIPGHYKVDLTAVLSSAVGGGADNANVEVRKNGGTTTFDTLHFHRLLSGGGNDVGAAGTCGIVFLGATDTLEVWATNDNSTDNLIFSDLSLNAFLLRKTN